MRGRRGTSTPTPIPGDPTDRFGFVMLVEDYLAQAAARGYSPHTLRHRRRELIQLVAWLQERGVARPVEVTRPMLLTWQRALFHRRKASGEPLSFRTQHHLIASARLFFTWATRHNYVLANPASELELPRLEHRLPRPALTPEQAEAVLAVPDLATAAGLRDRAILEVFYATGIRRGELVGLKLVDVDTVGRTVFVSQGKGRKDRLIPLGERAAAWVAKYRMHARPQLATGTLAGHVQAAGWGDPGTLFLTVDGTAIAVDYLTRLVREYLNAAGIEKAGSCHLFRHTLATVMLDGGADLRYVQQMLGHSDIAATQLYTHIAIAHLAAVHAATHPAATNTPRGDRDGHAQRQAARQAALARAGRRLSATDLLAAAELAERDVEQAHVELCGAETEQALFFSALDSELDQENRPHPGSQRDRS